MESRTQDKTTPAGTTGDELIRRLNGEIEILSRDINLLSKRENLISWSRLASIILGAVLIIVLFSFHVAAGAVGIFLVVILFLVLITRHMQVSRQKRFQEKRKEVIQLDIDCLHGKFPHINDGKEFTNDKHPYTDDLDIFGKRSLFQYLNRTQTKSGSEKLARALMYPSDPARIGLRQEAARELADQWDYRLDFLAKTTPGQNDKADFKMIDDWMNSPHVLFRESWLQWGRYIIPPVTLVLFGIVIAWLPWSLLVFVLMIPGVWMMKYSKPVNRIHEQTEQSAFLLKSYADLIRHIEGHHFKSPLLQEMQAVFLRNDGSSASSSIRQMSYLIRQLNVRVNPFAIILNLFTLWDFHWVIALEKWKDKNREQLPLWIEALGEMDFLITLANAAFLHPDWSFPDVFEEGPIEMKEVGHPLIFQKSVVCNDLVMPGTGRIRLITGSNMAGKSTFLRTIGVNMVLAYAGFPVCATSCSIPLKNVFTSMRTKDNLQENTSSFYAELKRLRAALEAVQQKENVFFLLDEILKGTNSVDRHTGSKALILQLLDADGVGLIATHDLELAALEKETGGKMENWSFDVEIRDGTLIFDYSIKRGVCSSFNATHLMQQMGFDLNYLKKSKS